MAQYPKMQHPNVCVDPLLTDEQLKEAKELSQALHPDDESVLEIAVAPKWIWPAGHRLKIRFLDGDPAVQKRVIEHAKEWEKHANIHFDFGDHNDAEVRISFAIKGQSWSMLGTQALIFTDQKRATMNFGWLEPDSPDDTYASVVLHEFGHALGCIHEHQHPENPIPWDEDAVYEYYTGPPNNWPKFKVKLNVLQGFDKGLTQYSDFDPKSIMLYPIPNEHTKGDWSIDWRNSELSETDKSFIAEQYPATPAGDQKGKLVTPIITGGEGNVSGTAPEPQATIPGGSDSNDPEVIKKRNIVARKIRAELQDLQNILTSIQSGDLGLADYAKYIGDTVAEVELMIPELLRLESNDQARTIQNLWQADGRHAAAQRSDRPIRTTAADRLSQISRRKYQQNCCHHRVYGHPRGCQPLAQHPATRILLAFSRCLHGRTARSSRARAAAPTFGVGTQFDQKRFSRST